MTTKLSKTQERCLNEIKSDCVRNGGHAAKSIFWADSTISALERKGLIERVGDEITLTNKADVGVRDILQSWINRGARS